MPSKFIPSKLFWQLMDSDQKKPVFSCQIDEKWKFIDKLTTFGTTSATELQQVKQIKDGVGTRWKPEKRRKKNQL